MSYLSLFLTSFASATLLPGGSEALFVYLLSLHLNPFFLLLIATLGNTLGAFVNYLLGKYATDFALRKNYMSEKHLRKASSLFEKYGAWSLLFSWLPIIGDPLTFVAGVVRYEWWKFIIIVGFSKFARYIFVYLGFLAIAS
ncbi:YqaA family protein [Sulfurospirillum diekertiae]|uniref:Inner membrane protein YqaA n=1 Tax=Sulfurospirillum diekertiae TaxID=1854492 RepID=A0A1Y0HP77_9BACT|nr:YqaA family protein [Sulfurospirillum diekertiae]ARU49908.1 Inner membrane protein YqaA [Sulfurospirillum diekertiae]ASC94698.1 Inner membrane protein YqaA [Sulfurospirillum diekertiae]